MFQVHEAKISTFIQLNLFDRLDLGAGRGGLPLALGKEVSLSPYYVGPEYYFAQQELH